MSNALAIAAVTATLQRLLIRGIPDLPDDNVTTRPPDRAFGIGTARDQINLFLYQITPNAAWRNRDIPSQIKPGETSQQPLALNLHYLISASGAGDEEIQSHRWLGKAMSILHDHAILGRSEIRDAIEDPRAAIGESDLYEQVERVRITPLSLSIEDLSKLWTTFTTPYRVSAAYEASVVLIESTQQPIRSPLPVLERKFVSQPNLLPPFPTLTHLEIPNPQNVARCGDGSPNSGDLITLKGYHLAPETGEVPEILLQHPRRREPLHPFIIEDFSANQITFRLPDDPDPTPLASNPVEDPNQWLVGVYRVTIAIRRTRLLPDGSSLREILTTNEMPLAIAPRFTSPPSYEPLPRRVVLTCTPRILPEQRAVLLLGDYQLISKHDTITNTLEFTLPSTVPAGDYFVRLRVDGIDSLLVLRRETPPKLEFDPGQKVTVS